MCSNVHQRRLLAENLEILCLIILAAVLREWSGLEAVVERTLLGDEETVALLEGDAVSVDEKVSILFRIDCVVLSRALFLPFLPEICCHRFLMASVVCLFFHSSSLFVRISHCSCLLFLPRLLFFRSSTERCAIDVEVFSNSYLEYLSSGEKRAGCADLVTSAPWTFFKV